MASSKYFVLVKSLRITSTKGSRSTGLKKCNPTNLSGCSKFPESCSISMLEVLVAKIAVDFKSCSIFSSNAFLASNCSIIASITISASPIIFPSGSGLNRLCAESSVSGSFSRRLNKLAAFIKAGSIMSFLLS